MLSKGALLVQTPNESWGATGRTHSAVSGSLGLAIALGREKWSDEIDEVIQRLLSSRSRWDKAAGVLGSEKKAIHGFRSFSIKSLDDTSIEGVFLQTIPTSKETALLSLEINQSSKDSTHDILII